MAAMNVFFCIGCDGIAPVFWLKSTHFGSSRQIKKEESQSESTF
jgi:hypothetical protein